MSQDSSRFVLNVTWTWPVMLVMLVFAMLPVYGPLMPTIEGSIWPVTTKVAFVNSTPVDGGVVVQMSYIKTRECEFLGVSVDNTMTGESVEFHLLSNANVIGTWPTGPHLSRPWFVGAPSLDNLRLRWVHRCNPLWLTVTQAYP